MLLNRKLNYIFYFVYCIVFFFVFLFECFGLNCVLRILFYCKNDIEEISGNIYSNYLYLILINWIIFVGFDVEGIVSKFREI